MVHTQRSPLAHEGQGTDSSGGICFVNPTALQTNDVIEATLSTVQGTERFALKVRWCRAKGDQFLIGAQRENNELLGVRQLGRT